MRRGPGLGLQGAALVVVLLFVGANLLVDVLYGLLDPRLRRLG